MGVRTGRPRGRPPTSDAPLSEDELRRIVARLARKGGVTAAKFYYETWIKPSKAADVPAESDPFAEVDELARKRVAA